MPAPFHTEGKGMGYGHTALRHLHHGVRTNHVAVFSDMLLEVCD